MKECTSLDPTLFTKPLVQRDFPDPFILWDAAKQEYVAFATRLHSDAAIIGMQRMISTDLQSWSMPESACDVSTIPDTLRSRVEWWAPEVVWNAYTNHYHAYVSLGPDDAHDDSSIHLFVSSTLRGVFVYKTELKRGPGFTTIDASPFIDPKTGTLYLYYGSGFGPIYCSELSLDGASLIEGTETIVLYPSTDYSGETMIEGGHVLYVKEDGTLNKEKVSGSDSGWYLLFASKGNCWEHGEYAVIVARSRYPNRDFERFARVFNAPHSEVLSTCETYSSPGHNSFFFTKDGELLTTFHALNTDNIHNNDDPWKRKYRFPWIARTEIDTLNWKIKIY